MSFLLGLPIFRGELSNFRGVSREPGFTPLTETLLWTPRLRRFTGSGWGAAWKKQGSKPQSPPVVFGDTWRILFFGLIDVQCFQKIFFKHSIYIYLNNEYRQIYYSTYQLFLNVSCLYVWSVSIVKVLVTHFVLKFCLYWVESSKNKKTQEITHVLVIEKRKGSCVEYLHSREEDAAGGLQTFCTILLPQLRGPTQHTLKKHIFPYRTTHPKSPRVSFEWSSFMSNALSIWVKLIDFDDISIWILDVTMTPWLYRIIKQPPFWELFIQAYAILNRHWITLQLFITSRKKSSCIGTCRPRE